MQIHIWGLGGLMHVAISNLIKVVIALILIICFIEIYKKMIETKLRHIQIKQINIIEICENIISYHKLPNIQIVQAANEISGYNSNKNRIILKTAKQISLVEVITAAHEVGHYVDISGEGFFAKVASKLAFEYIKEFDLTGKENFGTIKKFLILCKYSQLIVSIAYFNLISIIIMVSIF
jgi:hypothetical protein